MRCLPLIVGAAVLLCLLREPAQSHTTAVRERTIERTFAVEAAGLVRLETNGGRITVRSSADKIVSIRARERIHADNSAEEDEILRHLTLTIGQEGREVSATASYGQRRPFNFSGDSWPPVDVDFIVTVPAGFSAELKSGGGSVAVGDLGGWVRAHTGGGSLEVGRIGGDISAVTGGGSLGIGEGGRSVDATTGGGSVALRRACGPVRLVTGGGGVHLGVVGKALQATTGGGSVRAEIAGPLADDCLVETSGGSIDLTVDHAAAFVLDAAAGHSQVDADGLTLEGARGGVGRGELTGRVNGGGPQLKLRSGDGRIEISSR